MRYLTGEELRKTLGWWLVLAVFAAGVGVTYMRTLDSSPFGHVTSKTNASYDYVIVGGGATGCVLAARLSEDPRVTVLLLEAGGEEAIDMWNHVPLWNPIRHGATTDWGLYTVPQKHACKSAKNQKCPWIQPKILGGKSFTDQPIYNRASPTDFVQWAADKGRTWAYENVLPYYLKSEDMEEEDFKISDFHSTNGPLPVSGASSEISHLHEMFLEGSRELKNKPIDCNNKEGIGFCRLFLSVKDGERFSTAKDFLRPIMSRQNLHVSTHSNVIKILISKSKAVGVEYVRNGQKRTVGAGVEVILSAGTVGTPHVLLLSGIGPKAMLSKLGIPIVADLPVGQNLQEHIVYKIDVQTNESIGITHDNAFSAWSYLQFLTLGKGLLASGGGIFGNALLRTDVTSKQNRPDVQLTFSAINEYLGDDKKETGYVKKISSTLATKNDTTKGNGFSIFVELLRPESKGKIKIESTNPFTPPLIDPNYLFNPKDIQSLIKGIKVAISMLSTSYFRSIRSVISNKPYSPCIQHRIKSDAYWECVLRHSAVGNGQAVGTCAMGSAGSPGAVVDSKLRVLNVTNLRVADASVIPSSVSGDMLATRVMLGEKTADLLRGHESVKWYRRLSERALKAR